jgi:hypothetical protein
MKLLINFVLFLHTIVVLFIYFSWPVFFIFPQYNFIYLFILIIVLIGIITQRGCILTQLENRLRHKAIPETKYTDTCIPYYSKKWFKINFSKTLVNIVFSILLLTSLSVFAINLFYTN